MHNVLGKLCGVGEGVFDNIFREPSKTRDEVFVVDGRGFGGASTNGIGITEIRLVQNKIRIKEVLIVGMSNNTVMKITHVIQHGIIDNIVIREGKCIMEKGVIWLIVKVRGIPFSIGSKENMREGSKFMITWWMHINICKASPAG